MLVKRIIIGFTDAIQTLKSNSLAGIDPIMVDRILTEMITQCMDFMMQSTVDNNVFKDKNRVPYLVRVLIPSAYGYDEARKDLLNNDFIYLYMSLRDKLERECFASKVVEKYGKFNYILRDLRSNLIVIEHVSDEKVN